MTRNCIYRYILILLVCTLVAACVLPASGLSYENEVTRMYMEDGSWLTEELEITMMRSSGTVTANKSRNYYGNDGSLEWTVTLTGTFSYTGDSAVCTSSNCSVSITDYTWYTVSRSASRNENRATAAAVMGQKLNDATVARVPVSLSLSCDVDGNVS